MILGFFLSEQTRLFHQTILISCLTVLLVLCDIDSYIKTCKAPIYIFSMKFCYMQLMQYVLITSIRFKIILFTLTTVKRNRRCSHNGSGSTDTVVYNCISYTAVDHYQISHDIGQRLKSSCPENTQNWPLRHSKVSLAILILFEDGLASAHYAVICDGSDILGLLLFALLSVVIFRHLLEWSTAS